MGFLSSLRHINEITHAKRLARDLQITLGNIHSLSPAEFSREMDQFVRTVLSYQFLFFEGRSRALECVRQLADEARLGQSLSRSSGLGCWLASAYYESIVRECNEAKDVFESLEEIFNKRIRENYRKGKDPALWEPATIHPEGEPYYEVGELYDNFADDQVSIGFFEKVPYRENGLLKEFFNVAVFYGNSTNLDKSYEAFGQDEGKFFQRTISAGGKTENQIELNSIAADKYFVVGLVINSLKWR